MIWNVEYVFFPCARPSAMGEFYFNILPLVLQDWENTLTGQLLPVPESQTH